MNKAIMFKKLVCCFFIFIISGPLLLGSISVLFNVRPDVTLTNDNSNYEAPVYSVASFLEGRYQTDFENYFNTSFFPRGFIIRTYNQLNFSLFKRAKTLEINDGYIYERLYLDDYCGLVYNPENPEIKSELDG